MGIQIIETYYIDWAVHQGEPVGDEVTDPTPDPNNVNGIIEKPEYQWQDEVARLIEGPEQLVGYYALGREVLDTRTIVTDDMTGDIVSDTVARTYPAYTLQSITVTSDLPVNWTDPTNPAKPRQWGGPILTKLDSIDTDMPTAMPGGTYASGGIHQNNAVFNGFVMSPADLPSGPIGNGDNCFLIDLTNGRGYVWFDSVPGLGQGRRWTNSGVAHAADLIDLTPVDTVKDLPLGEDAPDVGMWRIVSDVGRYGTVYEYQPEGWLNIGPIHSGDLPYTPIDEELKKSYISGYIYPNVFDRCSFRYVPRLSGETQLTYGGDVDIETTGWFPQLPLDAERDIYPMDSVTHCLPDDRASRTITYFITMTTANVSHTITVYQDVYQPTYRWGDIIRGLLSNCYFTNGIYH